MKKGKMALLMMLGLFVVSVAAGCSQKEAAIEAVSLESEPLESEPLESESLVAESSGAESPEPELVETTKPPGSELLEAETSEEAIPEATTSEETTPQEIISESADPVKGIYVTGPMAGTENMNNLIALVDETELNALVIDVKNDEGYVVCSMESPTVSEVGAVKRYVRDMPALVQKCKEKGIYLIARIVAFKDPLLAEAKPEWSLHLADGSIFRDKDGLAWVNPYEEAVWDYLVEVGLEAARMGFDEIQYDYIRFSTDKGMKDVDFGPSAAERSKEEVVTDFTAYACEKLHAAKVAVSADVYGVVIDSEVDQQIVGQNYVDMSRTLDYICPMVYPSHYGPYNYQIPVPDAQPYDTVKAAMQASKKVMAGVEQIESAEAVSDNGLPGGAADNSESNVSDSSVSDNHLQVQIDTEIAALEPMEGVRAGVRPWLQDFTASWVKGHIKYGPQQIRDQIQAVYDAGYDEWILWNASNRYTKDGLLSEEGAVLWEDSTESGNETIQGES